MQESVSTSERNGDETRPGLGEDPLYAVPRQVMAKMRAKQEMIAAQSVTDETVSSTTPPSGSLYVFECLTTFFIVATMCMHYSMH